MFNCEIPKECIILRLIAVVVKYTFWCYLCWCGCGQLSTKLCELDRLSCIFKFVVFPVSCLAGLDRYI